MHNFYLMISVILVYRLVSEVTQHSEQYNKVRSWDVRRLSLS